MSADPITWQTRHGDTVEVYYSPTYAEVTSTDAQGFVIAEEVETPGWRWRVTAANNKKLEAGESHTRRHAAVKAAERYHPPVDGTPSALERIAALHKPYGIYDECGHEHTEEELDDPESPVVEVDEVGLTCELGLMYRVCQHCCLTGRDFYDSQTEDCVTNHEHGVDSPICPTMAALAGEVQP